MSGGVDSSVAAALLQQAGYEVIGITMRLWTQDDAEAPRHHKRCCSIEDTADAKAACDALGIRHYVLNLEREFAEGVVDYFVQEYSQGRTPNPCLACNDKVKFRPLLEYALALEAGYLATGHYARVRRQDSGFQLWRANDLTKDQSYVLFTLGQRELARTLFPIGEHTKAEVRRMARELGLPNADKPDSVDICFVPTGDYRSFVNERMPSPPGDIIDMAGNRLGRHDGILGYTVGQRRGLPARGGREPLFVVSIDASANAVVAGSREDLLASEVIAEAVTFIAGEAPAGPQRVEAKVRYRSAHVPALVTVEGGRALVRFQEPQHAITPGQAIVFYAGERVLGGGTIAARRPAAHLAAAQIG